MMNSRANKPASAGSAAVLVVFITLLFVGYILLVPAGERERILEGANATRAAERLLLDEAPGRLEFTDKAVTDHDISNMYLSETRNSVILHQENPFTVSNGWFSETKKVMTFSVPQLTETESAILSFQATQHSGDLLITLNGQPIFSGPVPIQNPPPVVLPRELLSNVNRLEFSVTGGFFATKRFALTDVKVIGEVTQRERQRSVNTFTISESEKEHLDNAFLDFYPICEQQEVGVLTITLNGKTIFAATPSCDSLNRQDLYKEDLREGRNELTFSIDRGSYRVENVRVRTVLEPVKSYIDYFTIKEELYDDILDDNLDVILRITFVDDGTLKHARINVNGRYDVIDQTDDEYEEEITAFIKEGNNYLEIQPLKELNIARLEVEVE